MYYIEDEHNPPHIHAKYNEYEGIFNIATGIMTRGDLPKNAKHLVLRSKVCTKLLLTLKPKRI